MVRLISFLLYYSSGAYDDDGSVVGSNIRVLLGAVVPRWGHLGSHGELASVGKVGTGL